MSCCETMKDQCGRECDSLDKEGKPIHEDRFDCPDVLIAHFKKSGVTGIIIHDGGSSIVQIHYCPWCGSKLEK